MFEFNIIKQQIDYEYAYGIRDFEITGGEPSEHVQLRNICQYIKNKDAHNKIAIITNGGLYNKNVWDLINEVLVSYHLGKDDNSYNKSMFPLGCTYNKVKKTIIKAKQTNKLIRSNSVIGTFNIKGFHYVVKDLVEFGPHIINILPVNLFDDAKDMGKYIDYNDLRPLLKTSINFLNKHLPNTIKFIRYIPFCDMIGYEQYIVGQLQHIYDWFDWNIELNGINEIEYAKCNKSLGKYGSLSIIEALNARDVFYEKHDICLNCKYYLICDGVEKHANLVKCIKPQTGNIVKNAMHYIKNTTYDFYRDWYNLK